MIFGQNYFDVLTSRIGGASNSWNRQGLSNVNSRSRTNGARGSSRTSGAGNGYYGLSANTIKAMNNAYNTTANKSYMADTNVADGAVKVENAGRKLSYGELYQEKNTDELLKTVKNFVEGYNEISSNARNSTITIVRNRAGRMSEDVLNNASDLRQIGIGYNSKNGELSLDEEAFKGASKDNIKKTFAGASSFGQKMRSNASLTSQAAVTASRYSINTGIYGSNGRYGSNSLLGGYGGYSSLLSSMFSSWF